MATSMSASCLSRPTRAGGLVPAPGLYGFRTGSTIEEYTGLPSFYGDCIYFWQSVRHLEIPRAADVGQVGTMGFAEGSAQEGSVMTEAYQLVGHLENDLAVTAVGPCGERAADVDQPHPDTVVEGELHPAWLGEQEEEWMVEGQQVRLELRRRWSLSEMGRLTNLLQCPRHFAAQRPILRSKIQIRYSFHFSLT